MTAAKVPFVTLNDGRKMPQFGLGVWQVSDDMAEQTVLTAFKAGYRLVDTAKIYENEVGVGKGLKASGLPRQEIFLTTKLWNLDQGYDKTLKAMDASLKRLQQDYVDLYLIHWPLPMEHLYADTWKALVKIKADGLAKSIGVSNFNPAHIQHLIDEIGEVPSVNQIELHPYLAQRKLQEFHRQHGIITEAWSPLDRAHATQDPVITQLAAKYQRTPAQIVLRWHIQQGIVVIPKSVTPARIVENITLFDFELAAADMALIDAMDRGPAGRRGGDPETARHGL